MFNTSIDANNFDLTELEVDTLTALASANKFEGEASGYLRKIRDFRLYRQDSYKSFEEYCDSRMSQFGGYRRINQLLGFTYVQETAGEQAHFIKNERQARPLLRLTKHPEKLRQAIALAMEISPNPTESVFAEAANKIIPISRNKKKVQEPLVPQGTKVKVSSQNHYRFESEGTVHSKPSADTSIVEFAPGELEAIADRDLEISSHVKTGISRTWTQAEHEEAIALIEEKHKRELEQIEADIKSRLFSEIQENALSQSAQELRAVRESAESYKKQNLILQEKIYELKSAESLKFANECLTERIEELERALEARPQLQWQNTFTQQATSVLNADQDKFSIKTLAKSAPKNLTQETADELISLLCSALCNLALALPNPSIEVLRAAGEILKCDPDKEAIATGVQVQAAVREVSAFLEKPNISWSDFLVLVEKYQLVKQFFYPKLSAEQQEQITALKNSCSIIQTQSSLPRGFCPADFAQEYQFKVGDRVKYKGSIWDFQAACPSGEIIDLVFNNFQVRWVKEDGRYHDSREVAEDLELLHEN